jgi:hypothetical protein
MSMPEVECGVVSICAQALRADGRDGRGRPAPDRVDFDPMYDPDAPVICELCGSPMRYVASCKIVCPNCGYRRDCSDP